MSNEEVIQELIKSKPHSDKKNENQLESLNPYCSSWRSHSAVATRAYPWPGLPTLTAVPIT